MNIGRDYIAIYWNFWFISVNSLGMEPSFSITNGAVMYDEFPMYQSRLGIARQHPNFVAYKNLGLCLVKGRAGS
jgi:hypothetical protein